jgi:hypothetical protein
VEGNGWESIVQKGSSDVNERAAFGYLWEDELEELDVVVTQPRTYDGELACAINHRLQELT